MDGMGRYHKPMLGICVDMRKIINYKYSNIKTWTFNKSFSRDHLFVIHIVHASLKRLCLSNPVRNHWMNLKCLTTMPRRLRSPKGISREVPTLGIIHYLSVSIIQRLLNLLRLLSLSEFDPLRLRNLPVFAGSIEWIFDKGMCVCPLCK